MADDYELIDSGGGRKYERFGNVSLVRPCSQALWRPADETAWRRATATFDREDGNRWYNRGALPKEWTIETAGIMFRLSGTDFGHLGIFPEQRAQWKWIRETLARTAAPHLSPHNSNTQTPSRSSTSSPIRAAARLRRRRAARRCATSTPRRAWCSGRAKTPP